MREPLGAIGTVAVPVLVFVVLGRLLGRRLVATSSSAPALIGIDVPVFASVMIALSAVLSLVTIISIYREGGILKRLRATPLRPYTILTAHVLVKLVLTAVTLMLMMLAGKRYYPVAADVRLLPFTVALLFSTFSILSIGFLIASIVPTARFAQPIGTIILYPMLGLSGLFVPVAALPPAIGHAVNACVRDSGDRIEERRGERPLVLGNRVHRLMDDRGARSAVSTATPEIFKVRDRRIHAGDVLVHIRAGFELVRCDVGDEVLAKRRQTVDRLAPAPREPHVRREDLVAGADEVVAVERLHVDFAMGCVVNRVEKDFRADAMRAPSHVGDIDDTAGRVRRHRAGNQ